VNDFESTTSCYWSIDAPGLDEAAATQLARTARSLRGVSAATPVNPKKWFTRHLDIESVQFLKEAIEVAVDSGKLLSEQREQALSVLEDYREWLQEIG
jgi:inorganic triphosphatase YgiF